MKQQLLFAAKLFALSSVYLFTRSRTAPEQRRFPEKSLAVLFVLENLKRILVNNGRLISAASNQVELLENDIRLLKAVLNDSDRIRNIDAALEELIGQMQEVVREAEDVIAVALNQVEVDRTRNFFQRALGGQMKVIRAAKDVSVIRAKVKTLYERGRVAFAAR